jgi:hypothetical protein
MWYSSGVAGVVADVGPNEVVGNVLIRVVLVGMQATGNVQGVVILGG